MRGRLLDLCKPVQRKYANAVAVAGGRHMDAIVVDTQKTGFECIQYVSGAMLLSETNLLVRRTRETHRTAITNGSQVYLEV